MHPTGNYMVTAFNALVRFYSIYPKEIAVYNEIQLKSCKEMKFTSQGDLLACQKANEIIVIRFFTIELPENYIFSWHKGNVRQINWLEDDTGFVSTAGDNTIAVWLLPKPN